MALAIGDNVGFCASAPAADPGGSASTIDEFSAVQKDTSPASAVKIVEIGIWIDNATEEANFEVGLYAADGGVVPGEAGTLLFSATVNAKGTTAGWKSVTVDWTIDPSTDYWLAVQVDNTATATNTDAALSGGPGFDLKSASGSLTDPFAGGAIFDTDGMVAVYAVWEAAGGIPAGVLQALLGDELGEA
jgi:hypothetical protein